ncbi:MAG: type VI secretion protein IcmF/TssM N-terminal domain-containing protein [Thiohalomonadales bacterium]
MAIIVSIKLEELLQKEEKVPVVLAQNIQKLIIVAQTALKLQLPIHTVVTNLEVIKDTNQFFNALDLKDTGGAFGYCVDRKNQFASLVEFVDTAYTSMYRALNLLRLTLHPTDVVVDQSLIHFTPEKIKATKSKVSQFLESMLPDISTDSSKQIGSLYFTANYSSERSQQDVSLGTNTEKESSKHTFRHELFGDELYTQVIPALDYLEPVLMKKNVWSKLLYRNNIRILVSVFTTIFVMLTFSLYQNMSDLIHIRSIDSSYSNNTHANIDAYSALNELGIYIEKLADERQARWNSNFGFTKTDHMLDKLKRRYAHDFKKKILTKADNYLDSSLDLLTDVPEARLVFQHVNFLHNRIGLLQSDWASLPSTAPVPAVARLDYRVTIPDLNDVSSIKMAEFMSKNYFKYLKWQTDENEIARMQGRDQYRLRELVMSKNMDMAWLTETIEHDKKIPEYSLQGITEGFAKIDDADNVSLDLAYSKHGRDALLAIIGDMETSLRDFDKSDTQDDNSELRVASTIVVESNNLYTTFLDQYNVNYVSAWAEYLSFYTRGFQSSGGLDNVKFVTYLENGKSPYNKLFARAFEELTPVRDSMVLNGERVPSWLQDVLDMARTIRTSTLEEVRSSVDSLPSLVDKAGKYIAIIDGLSNNVTLNVHEALVNKRNVDYQTYSSLLSDIIGKTHRPKDSFELLETYLGNVTTAQEGKTDLINELLIILRKMAGGEGNDIRWLVCNILRAQMLDVVHILFIQASKYIQSSWVQLYKNEYDRQLAPLTLYKKLSRENKFLSFYQDYLKASVSRDRLGIFTSEKILSRQFNFTPQYLNLLGIADRISNLETTIAKVSIEAIPTGINSDSKEVPFQTRLTIECGTQTLLLTNKNYKVEESIEVNPLECTSVVIKILIGKLTLTKRYTGEWSYFDFRRDFQFGQRSIPVRELEVSNGLLQDYDITKVIVGYRIKEGLVFETLAKLREVSFPEYIIDSKNPITIR